MANRTPAGLPPTDMPSVIGWLSKQIGDVRADVRRLEAGQGRTLPDDFRFFVSEDGSQVTIEQVSTGDVVTLANPVAPPVRSVDGEIGAVKLPGFADPADPDVPALRTIGVGPFDAAAGNDPRFSSGGPPSGPAGGALAGTYPNPTLAAVADQSMLGNFSGAPAASTPQTKAAIKAFLAIVPGDITGLGGAALLNVGTTIGTVAAGNDPRFSAAAGPAGGVLSGTYPNPAIAPGAALGTPSALVLTNATALPLTTGVVGTLPVGSGGTGVTSSTGTGSNVLSASPVFTGAPTGPTQSAGDNSTRLATTAYADSAVAAAVTGLLHMRGSTDCSVNPNYPVAVVGDAYVVTVAGKIGGSSGVAVDVGDVYFATAANGGGTQGAVGASWDVLEHNLAGALLSANNLSDVANTATALANLGGVPITRTVNGHALSSNVTVTAADVGAPSGSGTSTGANTGDQDLTPYAPKASPAFTGSPTAPTQAAGDNSTKLATTAYTDSAAALKVARIQGDQGAYLGLSGTVVRTPGDPNAGSAWDASTNTPTLANGVGVEGDIYYVTVGGTRFGVTFLIGDYVTYQNGIWVKSAVMPTRGYQVGVDYTVGPDLPAGSWGPHVAPGAKLPGQSWAQTGQIGPSGFMQVVGRIRMGSPAVSTTTAGMGVGFQNILFYDNDPTVAGTKLTTSWGFINEIRLLALSQYVQTRNELDLAEATVGGFWDGALAYTDATGILDGGLNRSETDRGFNVVGFTSDAFFGAGTALRKRTGFLVEDIKAAGVATQRHTTVTTSINVAGAAFLAGTGVLEVADTTTAQYTVTDGVTDGNYGITSATANFRETDRGRAITMLGGSPSYSTRSGTITEVISATEIRADIGANIFTPPPVGTGRTLIIGSASGTLTIETGNGTSQTGYSKVTFTGIADATHFTGCQFVRGPLGTGSQTAQALVGAVASLGTIVPLQHGLWVKPLQSGVANYFMRYGMSENDYMLEVSETGTLRFRDRAVAAHGQLSLGTSSIGPVVAFYSDFSDLRNPNLAVIGSGLVAGVGGGTATDLRLYRSGSKTWTIDDAAPGGVAGPAHLAILGKLDVAGVLTGTSGTAKFWDGTTGHGQVKAATTSGGSSIGAWGDTTKTVAGVSLAALAGGAAGFIAFSIDGAAIAHTLTADATYLIASNAIKANGASMNNNRITALANGVAATDAATVGQLATAGAITLYTKTTQISSNSTSLRTLSTFAVAAGQLAADGDWIEVEYMLRCAPLATANNPTVAVTVGGTNVITSTFGTQNSGTGNATARMTITRLSSTSVRCCWFGNTYGFTAQPGNWPALVPAADFTVADLASNTMTILLQGQNSAGTNSTAACVTHWLTRVVYHSGITPV